MRRRMLGAIGCKAAWTNPYITDGLLALYDAERSKYDSLVDIVSGDSVSLPSFTRDSNGAIITAAESKISYAVTQDIIDAYTSAEITFDFCIDSKNYTNTNYRYPITATGLSLVNSRVSGGSQTYSLFSAFGFSNLAVGGLADSPSTRNRVAITVSNGSIKMYYKSQDLLSLNTITRAITSTPSSMTSLASYIRSGSVFRRFAVYNRALTQAEVEHNMAKDDERYY